MVAFFWPTARNKKGKTPSDPDAASSSQENNTDVLILTKTEV